MQQEKGSINNWPLAATDEVILLPEINATKIETNVDQEMNESVDNITNSPNVHLRDSKTADRKRNLLQQNNESNTIVINQRESGRSKRYIGNKVQLMF